MLRAMLERFTLNSSSIILLIPVESNKIKDFLIIDELSPIKEMDFKKNKKKYFFKIKSREAPAAQIKDTSLRTKFWQRMLIANPLKVNNPSRKAVI